ncbi:MAG: hypothetical protein ACK42Z_01455 [Candidatus Kapaibacteriota bacterium]
MNIISASGLPEPKTNLVLVLLSSHLVQRLILFSNSVKLVELYQSSSTEKISIECDIVGLYILSVLFSDAIRLCVSVE